MTGATDLPEAAQPDSPGIVRSSDLFGGTVAEAIERGADISPCGRYRYTLWRKWGPGGTCMFVGLNPSTADETEDDPTIRRCVAYATEWGYSGLCMTNLFAYRATKPADMMAADDPIGPDNDDWLRKLGSGASIVVAAWGVHGTFGGRHATVRKSLPRLHYLRLTKDGHPGHPLYLPKALTPQPWLQT